jgi:hypothetical protein
MPSHQPRGDRGGSGVRCADRTARAGHPGGCRSSTQSARRRLGRLRCARRRRRRGQRGLYDVVGRDVRRRRLSGELRLPDGELRLLRSINPYREPAKLCRLPRRHSSVRSMRFPPVPRSLAGFLRQRFGLHQRFDLLRQCLHDELLSPWAVPCVESSNSAVQNLYRVPCARRHVRAAHLPGEHPRDQSVQYASKRPLMVRVRPSCEPARGVCCDGSGSPIRDGG